jgi:hypothetical protein
VAGLPQSVVQEDQNHILKIRDPQGNILQAGDPGVTILEQEFCTSIYLDIPTVYPDHPGGTWELILEGKGEFSVQVMAQTGLHMDYIGRHVFRAGRMSPVRINLTTDAGAPAVDGASVKFQMRSPTGDQAIDIELFDDGLHGDGDANDGLFGGRVALPRGIYRPHVTGLLADGSPFERIYPVPIRVQGFGGSQSGDDQRVPGNTRMVSFEITNDSQESLNGVANQVYMLGLESSMGWATAEDLPEQISLAPGESRRFEVMVNLPSDASPGEVEETSLVVMERDNLAASDVLSVQTFVVEKITHYLPMTTR